MPDMFCIFVLYLLQSYVICFFRQNPRILPTITQKLLVFSMQFCLENLFAKQRCSLQFRLDMESSIEILTLIPTQ